MLIMENMKNRFKHRVLVFVVGLCASTTVFAQNILNLSQPNWNTGLAATSWDWQSFTVSETSILTTFAFQCNGNVTPTGTVDLLTGEGTSGTLLASTIGSVSTANSGPYQDVNFFAAYFNNVELSAGQYTIYVHDLTSELDILGTSYDSYSGGKFVSDYFGDSGYDATFFTPSPVPEPSALVLAGFGAISLLVIRRRKCTRKNAA